MKTLLLVTLILATVIGLTVHRINEAPLVIEAPDRNVPGTTTGTGRNSLTSPDR